MEYEPITSSVPNLDLNSQRKSNSASHAAALNDHHPASGLQHEPDCISLPGQLSSEQANTSHLNAEQLIAGRRDVMNAECNNSGDVENCVKKVQSCSDLRQDSNSRACSIAALSLDRELFNRSEIQQSETELERSSGHCKTAGDIEDGESYLMYDMELEIQQNDSTHSIRDDEFYEVQSLNSLSCSSPSTNSLEENAIKKYKETVSSCSYDAHTNPLSLALYLLCALLVYPILLALVPFLLFVKAVTVLCCCIPYYKRRHKMRTSGIKQEYPIIFSSRTVGSYHTVGIELAERMDGKTFVEYVISKLNEVQSHQNMAVQGVSYRLVSVLRWIACFSWWDIQDNVNLEEHIVIVQRKITTTINFTDFIEQLSKKKLRGRQKLWQLHFIPYFKTNSSSILLQIHHSIISRCDLKQLLVNVFSDAPQEKVQFSELTLRQPTLLETVIAAPGVVLKHLLQPSLSLLRLTKKLRYAYSSPMCLHEACQVANQCSITLHSLLLAPLSQSLMNLYSQKYPLGRIKVAIPVVSPANQNSAFFINLQLTKQVWDVTRLQQLDKEIHRSSKDSFILSSAAKVASMTLSPCTLDFLASSVLRGADVLFHVVYCPNDSCYIDDNSIASVEYWPPLFEQVGVGVCVVVYDKAFRVCVVTDYGVTDWPTVLLKQYIANYSELYRTFSF